VYSKEDLLADFRDVRESGNLGVGLARFYRKLKRQVSPRVFVTYLDELNKEGKVVVTATCWPPVGLDHKTVI